MGALMIALVTYQRTNDECYFMTIQEEELKKIDYTVVYSTLDVFMSWPHLLDWVGCFDT